MKFKILPFNETYTYFWQNQLDYLADECSFYMDMIIPRYDFELIVNKLSLEINNKLITRVSGFCGLHSCIISNYQTPRYIKGVLQIVDDMEYGFAYGINKEDWPIGMNPQTGWICIGNPTISETGVEFIQNCVAIISDSGELVSLWLRPKKLPFNG